MEKRNKQLNKILNDFLKKEAEDTDYQILAIRHFLQALNDSVEKCINLKTDSDDGKVKNKILQMMEELTEGYREEISSLLLKRGKFQEYILFIKNETQTPYQN